jgi:hypothetical protein
MSGSSSQLRRPYAAVALACAITAGIAAFLPWATGFGGWSELGVEHTEGLITLVAAFNGALAAALASRGEIGRSAYVRWALASGAAMLAAGLWFRMAVVGDPDPVYDDLNIFTFVVRTIDAGIGLVIAVVASVGYLVAVAVSLVREPAPRPAPASQWPLRG